MQLPNLNCNVLGKQCTFYEEIDSTQNEIWRLIENSKIHNGQLVMADIQTSGKGTHGRIWHTDEVKNIAFSFYIEMNTNVQNLEGITYEIAKTILEIFKEKYKIELQIKLPNDIVYNGKKVGGILTEAKVHKETVKYLVIGIGLNTNKMNFTDDIKDIATSIKKEFNIEIDSKEFIAEFCNKFEKTVLRRRKNKLKTAFLFPGQGSQAVGMGKDIYENYEEARKIYKLANKVTGEDIEKISFEGPDEVLNQTKYTQMAILIESLAIAEILKNNGIEANMYAGLSLGEYSALITAGYIDIEDGIKIVQKRGTLMQDLAPKGNWKMAAILGMDENKVIEVCKQVKEGFVVPANFNTIGQIVISGEESGILEAEKLAKENGAKKIKVLNTAGPFHTEKLADSANALKKELEKITFTFNSEKKVIKNLDGEFYKENDECANILSKHIINPVQFTKTLQNMYDNGVRCFVEIGNGKTLSGFVKRMKFEEEVKILNANSVETIENIIKFFKEGNEN